jgi:hypothetical protein
MNAAKIIGLLLLSFLLMGAKGVSPPDPMFIRAPNANSTVNYYGAATAGTPRTITINPAQKTLVLLVAGQSNWSNVTPTLYTPTNSTVVSQLNIFDGAMYPITTDVLGAGYDPSGVYGPGNISVRVADLLVTNGSFNNVIIVNFVVNASAVADWGTGGAYFNRTDVAMRRLAAYGITPATTGVTFGFLWGQGEQDKGLGTSQSAYAASLGQVLTQLTTAGFTGRKFICEETWASGAVSAAVEAAQTGIVDSVTIFSGGNLDAFNNTDRQADQTHFNDTGAPLVATAVYNAMHASGAPY